MKVSDYLKEFIVNETNEKIMTCVCLALAVLLLLFTQAQEGYNFIYLLIVFLLGMIYYHVARGIFGEWKFKGR